MASIQLAAYQGRTAKLTVVESSYSITDNTSILTWTLEVLGGSSNYYNMYNLQAIVNGTTVYGPTTKAWDTKVFPAAKGTKTGTVTIVHDPDGSHADVGFTLKGKVYNSGTETYNGTVSLTTIPRASEVSISSSNVTTNNSYTITVTPAVQNTFSHILKYSFGNDSGTIASLNTSSTTYSWQIPRSLAAQIPNSTESTAGALVITCETYNGSTLIGSKTCSCKLIVDSDVIPSLSSSSIQDGNATVRGKNWDIYLQNMSYVNINSMTGIGSQGSTIVSYWCTFEGTNYSSTSLNGLNSQIQARGLPTIGNRTLELWVVDSRGRSSAKSSKSYTVVVYSSPSINSYDAYRSNSSGIDTDDGTYFKYSLNCSISSCNNKNPFTVNIRWKIKGSSTDVGSSKIKNAVTTEASYNGDGTLGGGNIAINNTYEIIFEVSDAFSTITRSKDIGPAFELLHYHTSGKAVAFGKKSGAGANEELFEVAMPAKFHTTINGYRIEELSRGTDFDIVVNDGLYIVQYTPVTGGTSGSPTNSWGTLYVQGTMGSPYQIYIPDGGAGIMYKRSIRNGAITNWVEIGPTKTSQLTNDSGFLIKSNLLDFVYPVGSIYMSTVNTSPASFLGGTWERIQSGFLYGAESSWGTGNGTGTSTNDTSLTIDQMPEHNHAQSWAGSDATTNNLVTNKTGGSGSSRNIFGTGNGCRNNAQTAWHSSGATIIGTGFRGSGNGHSHAIPYIAVFMWRRTS